MLCDERGFKLTLGYQYLWCIYFPIQPICFIPLMFIKEYA